MSKRIRYVVLTSIRDLKLALVSHYLFHASSKMCFAVVRKLELYDGDNSLLHPSVSHMMKMKPFENQPKEEPLIPIDTILEKNVTFTRKQKSYMYCKTFKFVWSVHLKLPCLFWMSHKHQQVS